MIINQHFRSWTAFIAAVLSSTSASAQEAINGPRQINGGISITATAGSGGVTAKLLASKDAGNPTAYVIPGSGGCGSGVAATTASAAATFQLYVVPGLQLTGVADNTITAGNILVGGTATPGRVRDSGQTSRAAIANSTCIVGVAQESKTVGQDVLFRYDGVGTSGMLNSRTCVMVIGDPGAASAVLADDNDGPGECGNTTTVDWTITSVACKANAGSPTITPILTGGTSTSILTGVLTCGTGTWVAGTLNGSPVVHSFSADGATCSVTPCTVDNNITTAGGVAKHIVVRITGK